MTIPKYSRAPPDSSQVEDSKYYSVYRGSDGQIYVFWKGTNPLHLSEWEEDAKAITGGRIASWDAAIQHVQDTYGSESDTVHHDGFSRGGAIAQHFGGVGFGSASFPKYPPADTAESRTADDWFHKDVLPVVNTFDKMLPDMHPNDHPMAADTNGGEFDTPVKPIPDHKVPTGVPSRGYSGFACAFVGFPAKVKYNRGRHLSHMKLGDKHFHPRTVKRKRLIFDSAMDPTKRFVHDTPMEN